MITTTHWNGYKPLLIGMYIPAIPFFIAVIQILKLLNYIDQNQAFSSKSLTALHYIKFSSALVGIFYGLALPYIYKVAQMDDAPGVMLIGLIFTLAPLTIAVFAGVIQKTLRNALEIKSENELTV